MSAASAARPNAGTSTAGTTTGMSTTGMSTAATSTPAQTTATGTRASATGAAAKAPAAPPLRANRDFRLLWIGQSLSDFGSAMTYVVLPLVLLKAGYSTSVASTIGTATLVTSMVARLPAGYLTDHFNHRRLMLYSDLIRFALMAAVAVWTVADRLPLLLAVAAVVAAQLGSEVFAPSQSAVLRRVVPVEQRPTAISLNQARTYAADIAAPAAAGLLLAVSLGLPFSVDAGTFAASALCVALLSRRASRPAATERRAPAGKASANTEAEEQTQAQSAAGTRVPAAAADGFWTRLTAGLRYLVRDRFMRISAVYFAVLNLVFQALVYALILGVGRQHGGEKLVGAAMSSAAVTGLVGALVAPYLQRRLRLRVVLSVCPAIAGVLLAVTWRTGSDVTFVASFSALCLLTPLIGSVLGTIMSTVVPEEIYGRALTARGFTTEVLQPLGPLAAGVLLASLSLSGVAGVFALAFALLGALALILPPPPAPAGEPQA